MREGSRVQRAGCGVAGECGRIKIGDRYPFGEAELTFDPTGAELGLGNAVLVFALCPAARLFARGGVPESVSARARPAATTCGRRPTAVRNAGSAARKQ